MNRAELRSAADREHIRRNAYCLEGGLPPEQYVLSIENGGWCVYYSERGLKTEPEWFETEDEACDHLFHALASDPTTRIRNPHAIGHDPSQSQ